MRQDADKQFLTFIHLSKRLLKIYLITYFYKFVYLKKGFEEDMFFINTVCGVQSCSMIYLVEIEIKM